MILVAVGMVISHKGQSLSTRETMTYGFKIRIGGETRGFRDWKSVIYLLASATIGHKSELPQRTEQEDGSQTGPNGNLNQYGDL